jgi:pyruvate kinase
MQKRNKKSKKVKIMATVGPSSFDESIIRKMDLSGIDVFRVNM